MGYIDPISHIQVGRIHQVFFYERYPGHRRGCLYIVSITDVTVVAVSYIQII